MVSWVDDLLVMGEKNDVKQIKLDLKEAFVWKCKGALEEYMGNKIDFNQNSDRLGRIKFTQPVLFQKLEDEFELLKGEPLRMPAVTGQVPVWGGDRIKTLYLKETTKYWSGTALCMYKMQWLWPDIYNASQDCARLFPAPCTPHKKALQHTMKYVIET